MRPSIVAAVVRREFLEIVRNRLLLLTVVIPPVILTVLPVVLLAFAGQATGRVPPGAVEQIVASHPEWADMTGPQVIAAFALQQFLATFLILPAYIPLAIATYSIVGEKQTRSLEAVLAAPIRTTELLAGKAIASLVPGLAAAWIAYLAMVGMAVGLLGGRLSLVLAEPTWIAAVFTLGPAIGLVSVTAGIIISSRVNDPRVAQQIGAVILLPIIGLIVFQSIGAFLLDVAAYLVIALVVFVIGLIGIRTGAAIFGRETILTRWK